ncbi:helix-turn-helix domain-containing protein [Streptomyces hesseae]|uniref:Helix-turn-helix transcriptional regulator n=1 Tax=Streptomyces hesseae TaxID=3075519 RepID=A0ABU2SJA8_9ACTN|nr:helix-turn-helix transcriptional regulator [Streptomyces sp. DSM 40473]MDT0448990.1 helix-turn-helix transcriptional regulator [Streptomyces sp. DSM 40473]
MPPRSSPTARQARLGAELRKLREASGLPARAVGEFLGGNQATVSHIEAGRWGVSADRVRRLASFYSASDPQLVDALCAMTEARGKGWWEEYRGILPASFLDIAELENHASFLRSIRMLHVPGILQTADYSRELIGSGVLSLPSREMAARVEHRIRRREIFNRTDPPKFDAFIHEAALRMRYCSSDVMRSQLELLEETADWPSVRVRVIPFDTRITGSVHSVLYAGGPIPKLDTVQLDNAFDGHFLDAEAQLVEYRSLFDTIDEIALDTNESLKYIHRIVQDL